jgi:hypothetical protein
MEDFPFRQRLVNAASNLALLSENRNIFPNKEIYQKWRGICEDLSIGAEPQHPGESKVQATVGSLMDHDAKDLAKRILDLFVDFLRAECGSR